MPYICYQIFRNLLQLSIFSFSVFHFEDLKNVVRIAEKAIFNINDPGNANRVFDVVRGMVVCRSMTLIAQVLHKFINDHRIQIVRMKERFFKHPSPGGWRDCMICFWVKNSDNVRHICEVQIVHFELLTARNGLPGHAIYNHARNARELLTLIEHQIFSRCYFQPPWKGTL